MTDHAVAIWGLYADCDDTGIYSCNPAYYLADKADHKKVSN